MRFFIDTANLDEIREAADLGLIDGVTTNPSLMAAEGGDWNRRAQDICKLVQGPVSLEVLGLTAVEMLEEARKLVSIGPNVVIKIPMGIEGMKAVRKLHQEGIHTNVTLVFSPLQALLAAKAGASYVSPFVGRLDDTGQDGMALIDEILTIYRQYGFETQVLVASVRSPMHVLNAALLGAHVATIPFKILRQLAEHPLTDKGLEKFMKDATKAKARD